MKRRIGFACLIALALSLLLSTAAFAVAQREAVLSETEITIDLAASSTYRLRASVLPAKAKQSVIWRSGNKNIATVSTKGLVRAYRTGDLKISVRPSKVRTKAMCSVHVIDSMCPDSVVLHYGGSLTLNVFDRVQLVSFALPSEKSQSIRFRSSNPKVLSVTPTDGILTARSRGNARITAYYTRDPNVSAHIDFTVKRSASPRRIAILPQDNTLFLGETLQLSAAPTPNDASNAVIWSSTNTRIASVTRTGLVTGKREGIVKIKATSRFNKKVYTVRTLKIVDKTTPTSFSVAVTGALTTGSTSQLAIEILPETARDVQIKWRISDPNVAEVSPTGLLTLQNAGRARIVATTVKGRLTETLDIVVTDPTSAVCVITPARTTDIPGIAANIQRIEAVENSAYQVLQKLVSAGAIPQGDIIYFPNKARDRNSGFNAALASLALVLILLLEGVERSKE
ncbi:MAG: Ig-like domain-containing protein, partial [Christensenellales bacterium]